MTKITAGNEPAQLYPHAPASLLPLLERHLPYALPVYGTIKTNSYRPVELERDVSLPQSVGRISQEELKSVVWATFPANRVHDPPEVWAVIVHLPDPQSAQTRFYCSAERELESRSERDGGTSTMSLEGEGHLDKQDAAVWRTAQDLVNGAIGTIVRASPGIRKIGALNVLWSAEVLDMLAAPVNEVYDIWLAPGIETDRSDGDERIDKEGLTLDQCTIEDCEIIQKTREIKEDLAYYHARMAHISVVRPTDTSSGKPAPVAWLMTHAAGDQGAMYTVEGYRRRGLARWVVRDRLEKDRGGQGVRGHVWVARGNEGSEGLWRKLGWGRGWSVRWVYVR